MQYVGVSNIVDLVIQDGSIEPEKISINQGTMVAFENRDSMDHIILFKTGQPDHQHGEDEEPSGGHERSGVVNSGKYWLLEFLVPGQFQYKCILHGEAGLIAVRY